MKEGRRRTRRPASLRSITHYSLLITHCSTKSCNRFLSTLRPIVHPRLVRVASPRHSLALSRNWRTRHSFCLDVRCFLAFIFHLKDPYALLAPIPSRGRTRRSGSRRSPALPADRIQSRHRVAGAAAPRFRSDRRLGSQLVGNLSWAHLAEAGPDHSAYGQRDQLLHARSVATFRASGRRDAEWTCIHRSRRG